MTKYILEEKIDEKTLKKIAHDIKNGALVVFPTDTVYGIGTNAYLESACQKVYEVKMRPQVKPLSVLISNISMLKDIVEEISFIEQKLIDTFWPGPLTIKFKKKANVLPDIISAGDEFVRVRLIKTGITAKIIEEAQVPIVAPSANLSGSKTGTKIEEIKKELGGKVDYILDCNDVPKDEVSTIVYVENNQVNIIREGKIKKSEITAFNERLKSFE